MMSLAVVELGNFLTIVRAGLLIGRWNTSRFGTSDVLCTKKDGKARGDEVGIPRRSGT